MPADGPPSASGTWRGLEAGGGRPGSRDLAGGVPGDTWVADFDLHVTGCIPFTRFLGVGIFTGRFDVTINGTFDSHFSFTKPQAP